jgi:ribosomal protein S18 acetylase RimI-like enzyme
LEGIDVYGRDFVDDRSGRSGEKEITRPAVPESVFRIAGPADLDALYRFELLCFLEHPFRRDHIAWILENDRALTLVQDGDGGALAVMMLLFEGRTCRVLSVGVMPAARRRGTATRLMRLAESFARERACVTMRLEVSTQNLPAIELYRRLGYRTDGVLYGYYSWGEDAYSMAKPIPSAPEAATSAEFEAVRPFGLLNINQ